MKVDHRPPGDLRRGGQSVLIGAGTSPTAHRPNVTGAEIPLPVDSALAVSRCDVPEGGRRGARSSTRPIRSPSSISTWRSGRRSGWGFASSRVACTSAQDIPASVQALRAQGVGGIMQIPSIMIGGGFPALVKQARELGMVVVATNTGYPGAPLSIGASFSDNGYAQGLVMIRVLRGESPAKIPFQRSANPRIVVDLGAAADFGVTIPRDARRACQRSHLRRRRGDTVARDASGRQAPTSSRDGSSAWRFWLSALVLGLAFSALAWGVYIASRVLRFPDITPDGSFPARRRGGGDAHRRRHRSARRDDRRVLRRHGGRLCHRRAAHATPRDRAARRAFS